MKMTAFYLFFTLYALSNRGKIKKENKIDNIEMKFSSFIFLLFVKSNILESYSSDIIKLIDFDIKLGTFDVRCDV